MNHLQLCSTVLELTNGDFQAAIYALECGEFLASMGMTDDDQDVVELAHDDLKRAHNLLQVLRK